MTMLTRRRFLAVTGAAACASLSGPVFGRAIEPVIWRGVALGASGQIRLHLADRTEAKRILDRCLEEIHRLEELFSLYRADSSLSRLNRDGFLPNPDADFLSVLSLTQAVHEATGGVFDPTIQSLWASLANAHAGGQSADGLDLAAASDVPIGWEKLTFDTRRVAFASNGMALTLNGIAQGYITDRIAKLLRENGIQNALVNVGELRALDGRPDGSPWPVRLVGAAGTMFGLRNRALATSSASGTTFDDGGTVSHILHPTRRMPAAIGRRVTVEAPNAGLADALSTAFCMMDSGSVARAVDMFSGVRVVHR